VRLHAFLTSSLDGGEFLTSRSDHFSPPQTSPVGTSYKQKSSETDRPRQQRGVALFMSQSVPEWGFDNLTFMDTVAAEWRQTVALLVDNILTPVSI